MKEPMPPPAPTQGNEDVDEHSAGEIAQMFGGD